MHGVTLKQKPHFSPNNTSIKRELPLLFVLISENGKPIIHHMRYILFCLILAILLKLIKNPKIMALKFIKSGLFQTQIIVTPTKESIATSSNRWIWPIIRDTKLDPFAFYAPKNKCTITKSPPESDLSKKGQE